MNNQKLFDNYECLVNYIEEIRGTLELLAVDYLQFVPSETNLQMLQYQHSAYYGLLNLAIYRLDELVRENQTLIHQYAETGDK